ncbi:MAG: DNA-protecting protein DprA [Planctomycetota bacterium]|nr:MAG: DNA-protecting protein DprA [Planctomycetota bacterium]
MSGSDRPVSSGAAADVAEAVASVRNDLEALAVLTLHLVPGVGPRLASRLMERFGSARSVLNASDAELREVPGISGKTITALRTAIDEGHAGRELQQCEAAGIGVMTLGSPFFPRPLQHIPDPPLVLYFRGRWLARDELAVAIVGSRHCTHYGRRQTERLAGALARAGFTIVSGLARGIDGVAHEAALRAGGRTIAVTASGLQRIYPPEHSGLAERIVADGALLTECRAETPARAGLFPRRNRLISGLALGVIIVEARRNSGALHTARHAMEQGREVMAVPGPVDSLASEGCLALLRDGATLVRHADDVLESIGPPPHPIRTPSGEEVRSLRQLRLNDRERNVLELVTDRQQHLDELLRQTEIDAAQVVATLTVLEMKRLVRRLPGGFYVRCDTIE